jgi:hypothetical protein
MGYCKRHKTKEEIMFKTMATNWWTTFVGAASGFVVYIAENGASMPQNKEGWKALLVGASLAALGFVAKSATTGSRPGQ